MEGLGGGRARRLAPVVLACAAISLCAGVARAERPYLTQGGPVAVAGGGAVWFDEAPILFQPFAGGSTRIGWGVRYGTPWLQSSAVSVAGLAGGGRFLGGLAPGPLRPIDQPEWVQGGECGGGWVPENGYEPDFVVVGRRIVSAATCLPGEGTTFEAASQTREPLFSHDVRGGEWQVLRWLRGALPPVLASEGALLAVGELLSPSPIGEPVDESGWRMRVSIVDMGTGRTRARFTMPAGELEFAASDRLVLTKVSEGSAGRAAALTEPTRVRSLTYHSWLYSTDGRRIADLGIFHGSPRVSDMHVLTEERDLQTGESILAVRTIPHGRPEPLVGFDAPRRALAGLAFRWPVLVLDETTATPLPAEQATCSTGYYSRPSAPFLKIIDLADPHAYEPPPPPSPLEAARFPLPGRCPEIEGAR